jgi:serine/threonine-protein kinase
MESIVGQTISHYEFLERLGAGGMGEIYKARDSRLNRIVAVKVLAPGRTRDPERRRRFIQEAQAASGLNHPNIITIHDILSEGERQYMVMEHVSGQTLQASIAGGPLPIHEVLRLSAQIANALATAHAAGIIHRDLKPANVMVTSSGLVKVLDFGLAKLMDAGGMRAPASTDSQTQEPVTLTAAPLTVEGSIMGTVNYMSPEQAEGLKVDARSDIFSFGAVVYEMVTGKRAFEGESQISTLSAVLRDDVKPVHQFVPDTPAELEQLILRCLRKAPADRWQSMTEVATALTSMRARLESGVVLRPASAPPVQVSATVPPPAPVVSSSIPNRGSKKGLFLAAGSAAVLALALGGAWWQTHRPSQPAAAPVATAAPPAQPSAPITAPAPPAPEVKPDAAAPSETISPTAAPPPPTPVIPLGNKSKTPAPSPVLITPPAPKPLVAATPVAPAAAAPVPHAPAATELEPVSLRDGVPFRIALVDDVPVDTEVGHPLRFRALDGLRSGDVVVIAKGAIVNGSVAALAGKRNFFGERGKVRFQLTSVQSVDDGKISVRATPSAKNDGNETRPFETPKGAPKDKNLIAAGGSEYVAYVAGDQTVNVHK